MIVDLLNDADVAGEKVNKLVLTGGFGDSPYLRKALKKQLGDYNRKHASDVEFIVALSQRCGTGTAIGALMRTMDKENGPVRVLCMSVGVMRTIPYQPAGYDDEVNAQETWTSPNDRKKSVYQRCYSMALESGRL